MFGSKDATFLSAGWFQLPENTIIKKVLPLWMNFYILAVCKIVKALDFNFLAFYWDALTEASFLHICLYDSPLLIDAGFVIFE